MQIPSDVFKELKEFLSSKNVDTKRRWAWLDRPFMLTLVGVFAVALITTAWKLADFQEARRVTYQTSLADERLKVIRDLPSVTHQNANTLNAWMSWIIYIALQNQKPKEKRNQDLITKWDARITKAHQDYTDATPANALTASVAALFPSREIERKATLLAKRWREAEQFFQSVNDEFAEPQTLANPDKTKREWRAIIQQIEIETTQLVGDCYRYLTALESDLSLFPAK